MTAANPSELHRFLFDGLPVRGAIVRLTDGWAEVLRRHAASPSGAYATPVRGLLGEMAAAAVLMQAHVKFNGAVVLQIQGDGPVKLAVAEARNDLGFRCTATVQGPVAENDALTALVNRNGQGRCAITLDPRDRIPGQQPYQGVVSLEDGHYQGLSGMAAVLEQYMRQSEQLDTRIVLAADDQVAAGILVQRMPVQGQANLQGAGAASTGDDLDEAFHRIALHTASLTREELLTLPSLDILHRLFWEEKLLRHEPQQGASGPHFACVCSAERVRRMIESLGADEARSIVAEQGQIEVGCDFCGAQYRLDAVDAAQIFTAAAQRAPGGGGVH